MKTRNIAVAAMLALCGTAFAQTSMKITFKDASKQPVSYDISEVKEVTWETSEPADERIVDMGLSVKWASMNVGATTPYETGSFFQWGEVKPQTGSFNWADYDHCLGSNNTLTKYANSETFGLEVDNQGSLLPEDDAATVNWGEHWRTPTLEEFNELLNNVTKETVVIGEVKYIKLTSKVNGAELWFRPGGYGSDNKFTMPTTMVYLWLADCEFQYMCFRAWEGIMGTGTTSGNFQSGYGDRRFGNNVRPVYVP